jgi:hypothetical protein
MSEPGGDELAQARQWFKWWSTYMPKGAMPPPMTATSRKSLQRLAKALDQLDPAARFYLGKAMGGQAALDSAAKAIKECLASLKVSRGRKNYDLTYRFGVEFLVRAWEKMERRSPLTRWDDFQQFCASVVNDYDAPIPSQRLVRQMTRQRVRPA